jgi:hypothetical protein
MTAVGPDWSWRSGVYWLWCSCIKQCISEEDVAYQNTFKMSAALPNALDCVSHFFQRDTASAKVARILAPTAQHDIAGQLDLVG